MKKHMVIFCLLAIISGHFFMVDAVRKRGLTRNLKRAHGNREDKQGKKNLLNFEIMKDQNDLSNIQLKSSTFFNILASTRLMQNSGGVMSQEPIYRYIHNVHEHNENNGAVLVFLLFAILIFSVLFFIFYFIFRHHVKHVKFMNSAG
ncbi:conserved Plasmodium protein, unknown function [Plasmodium ovale]|uniref:Fam-h protein n=1 Tax=Plasmodium ovale TaxID=36330 RepID=A0A1C3L4J5_PLAOA|nr:conserved Plasmodium protein, unknown function [Plasmodium ovale]